MRLTGIYLRNLFGLREYSITPGQITRVEGANGVGKSSVLKGIIAALGGGNLATVAHLDPETGQPAGEPEAMVEIDDGAFKVERRGAESIVRQRIDGTAADEKLRRPAAFIEGMYDRELSDPIKILTAKDKKQLELLLEVLPLELTPKQIKEAVGEELWPIVDPVARQGHPLQVLTATYKAIYDARRGINVSKDDKAATVQQLKLSIPAVLPNGSKDGIQALEGKRDDLAARVEKARGAAELAYQAAISDAQIARDRAVGDAQRATNASAAVLKESAQKQIDAINASLRVALEELQAAEAKDCSEADAVLAGVREAAGLVRAKALDEVGAMSNDMLTVTKELEAARAQVERTAELRNTAEMIKRFEAEVETLDGKSTRYSEGLAAVEALCARILAAVPIPGLEIDGSSILLDKVPLEHVNTAKKVRFAVKVAALRAKKRALPAIFLDNVEALDSESLTELEAAIREEGVQAFLAIRTEGPLTVSSQ